MPTLREAESLFDKANKDFCVRQFSDFDFKRNCILIVNCDSDLFLHPCLRSLYKNVSPSDFSLIIFDNSFNTYINIELYKNYGFNNILFLDNTPRYIREGVCPRPIFQTPKDILLHIPSIMHCFTIDMMMKILKARGTKNLILADSDLLFKKNPFYLIDENYATIGTYIDAQHRFHPYFQYLNLEKLDIDYFDINRMLGFSTNDTNKYDTGAAFSEDLIRKNLNYKNIDTSEYVEHFGGGSYAYFVGRDAVRDIDVKDKPEKAYEIIWEWLKANQQYY